MLAPAPRSLLRSLERGPLQPCVWRLEIHQYLSSTTRTSATGHSTNYWLKLNVLQQPHIRVRHFHYTPLIPSNVSLNHVNNTSIQRHVETDDEADASIQDSFITEQPPYEAGRPWAPLPIKPLNSGKFKYRAARVDADPSWVKLPPHKLIRERQHEEAEGAARLFPFSVVFDAPMERTLLHFRLLHVIGTTQDPVDAWVAYSALLEYPCLTDGSTHPPRPRNIPFQYLHRLCRLISRDEPKQRTQFLRLMWVMYAIRVNGGNIHPFEWHALIHNAGKGWRDINTRDFRISMEVLKDMVFNRTPGHTIYPDDHPPLHSENPLPDIITYTTLINIACRTHDAQDIRRATSLLEASGIPPNRITHLALLKYFSDMNDMNSVRSTLLKLRHQDLELGLDGINSVMMACSYNGRLDLVDMLYRVMRHNLIPEHDLAALSQLSQHLVDNEFITVGGIKPNEITFTTMIQIMSYHGHFEKAVNTYLDMLNTDNTEVGAPLVVDGEGQARPVRYLPTVKAFRALFLGFFRHGVHTSSSQWNLENLDKVFGMFFDLPPNPRPNNSLLYWILAAYGITSGYNITVMRQVWARLEDKYPGPWGGDNHRLRKLRSVMQLPDAQAVAHMKLWGFRVAKAGTTIPLHHSKSAFHRT